MSLRVVEAGSVGCLGDEALAEGPVEVQGDRRGRVWRCEARWLAAGATVSSFPVPFGGLLSLVSLSRRASGCV